MYAAASLISARRFPNLVPHLMISSSVPHDEAFVGWCRKEGVIIHRYTPVFQSNIEKLVKEGKFSPVLAEMALGGVFGRYLAADIYRKWGGTSPYILYTDADTLWLSDPSSLWQLKFDTNDAVAIGPESQQGSQTNSGVLWIHVQRWLSLWPEFYEFCDSRSWTGDAMDQGLLLDFFAPNRSVLLPDRFNWKIYW
eukprot:CAMPEP_0201512020 /NCGR_PEP_ID=MMETSP0161_2-20130828/4374_1 /ASSEMBLY_ACC=CAM_ASM_000251 /TAXON_ID=180227 /ORGANISM="Neoparamoeba aestuarina, Strain SoJaBio B1-5/56/2" /LENGTH=194 /DNA_ID=CAMNT_0047907731 /DNA_START=132 /DNA_END=713 /DNA_ORIENTATION=-